MTLARLLMAGLLLTCGLTTEVSACTPPRERAEYVINHETYGDIGEHVLTFRCNGTDLVVETEVKVDVKLLFVTVYKRRARYREVWRDDRLIAYEGWTDEAGEEFVVKARAEDDQMVIDGSEADAKVPLDTVSAHPWNVDVVDRGLLFGMKDGRLLRVDVEAAGNEMIDIGSRTIHARKYVVRGDLERELWYDDRGGWIRWQLESRGKTVTITRQ